MDNCAVIDLGTNTFHLLIARESPTAPGFEVVYRQRFFIKLGEEGLDYIGARAFRRGIDAMISFGESLEQFGVRQVRAIGTAALRTAGNGQDFVDEVLRRTGIQVRMIDGTEEARLIYLGVRKAFLFQKENYVIMDIGGGSVEFILVNPEGVHWSRSFPIGVAVLYERFHRSEPILPSQVADLHHFLDRQLEPLLEQLKTFRPHTLVGASGTFDVMENFVKTQPVSPWSTKIALEDFFGIYRAILPMNQKERMDSEKIPDARADMIVVALILIDYVLQAQKGLKEIAISDFALKEGVLREMFDGK